MKLLTSLAACFFLAVPAAVLQARGQTAPAPSVAPSAQAAQPPAQTTVPQPGYTIKTQVDEVDLNFTVTDRHGHFIDNLQQKDFALLDNGRAPAQIYRFEQETNLPLRVGLLIDTSTSIRERFAFEQQAATAFLLQIPASAGR